MTTTAIVPVDLAVIDEHIRSLELATDIHDIVKQHSAAGALEHFAKEADLPLETQNKAAEWRIRAQRRGGQVLRWMPRGKAGRPKKNSSPTVTNLEQAIRDVGLSKQTAARWQTLAGPTDDDFDRFIDETCAMVGEELTTAAAVLFAKTGSVHFSSDSPDWNTPPAIIDRVESVLGTAARSFESEDEKIEHVLKLNIARRHMSPHVWGLAFRLLAEARGVRLGKGLQPSRSATVALLADEVGVPLRTIQHRVAEANQYDALPDKDKDTIRSGEKNLKQVRYEQREAKREEPRRTFGNGCRMCRVGVWRFRTDERWSVTAIREYDAACELAVLVGFDLEG